MAKRYSRRFVALKQEHSDYTVKGREAAGKCIIEINEGKGKVIFSVQNLKSETIYKPFLVCSQSSGSLGVPAGSLIVDEKGRGEIKFECDAANVLNSGKSLEQFNVMAIIFIKPEGMIVPLAGYTDEEIAWKNNFTLLGDRELKEEQSSQKVQNAEEENDIKTEADAESNMETEIETNIETSGRFTGVMPDVLGCIPCDGEVETDEVPAVSLKEEADENPVFEPKSIPEYKSEDNAKIWDFYEDSAQYPDGEQFKETAIKVNKSLKEISDYSFLKSDDERGIRTDKKITGEVKLHSDIEFILNKNTKMKPFTIERKEVKWIRISTKELVYLPESKWAYMNDAFVISSYKKYNHLILGYYEDDGGKELYLGVPDIYEQEKKQEAQKAGFFQFKCCEEGEIKNGRHGYWLLPMPL